MLRGATEQGVRVRGGGLGGVARRNAGASDVRVGVRAAVVLLEVHEVGARRGAIDGPVGVLGSAANVGAAGAPPKPPPATPPVAPPAPEPLAPPEVDPALPPLPLSSSLPQAPSPTTSAAAPQNQIDFMLSSIRSGVTAPSSRQSTNGNVHDARGISRHTSCLMRAPCRCADSRWAWFAFRSLPAEARTTPLLRAERGEAPAWREQRERPAGRAAQRDPMRWAPSACRPLQLGARVRPCRAREITTSPSWWTPSTSTPLAAFAT